MTPVMAASVACLRRHASAIGSSTTRTARASTPPATIKRSTCSVILDAARARASLHTRRQCRPPRSSGTIESPGGHSSRVRSWAFVFLAACGQQPSSPSPPVVVYDEAAPANPPPDLDQFDSAPVDYGPPDAGDPPIVACEADAAIDGGECPLPPSVCIKGWLVYYSDGTCIDSTCRYQTKLLECTWGCNKGACIDPHPTH